MYVCIMDNINFLTGRAMLLPVKSSRIPSDFTVGGGTIGDASFFLSVSTMWSEFGGSVTLLDQCTLSTSTWGQLDSGVGGGDLLEGDDMSCHWDWWKVFNKLTCFRGIIFGNIHWIFVPKMILFGCFQL